MNSQLFVPKMSILKFVEKKLVLFNIGFLVYAAKIQK